MYKSVIRDRQSVGWNFRIACQYFDAHMWWNSWGARLLVKAGLSCTPIRKALHNKRSSATTGSSTEAIRK